MYKPKYITKLDKIEQLSPEARERLMPVAKEFDFRTNEYYQSLINWEDPNDPIRRLVIPDLQELNGYGELDASDEAAYTVVEGLEHKYEDTALLLVNDVCGAYCRFCFRKRLFMNDNDEVVRDVSQGIKYLRAHPEINNVLLTGGDPLIMSTGKLETIIKQLRDIEHIQIIRIGSKMPAFNPFRFINDRSLLEMLSRYSRPEKKIYVMAHFNHPRELSEQAVEALTLLQKAGVVTINQSPMIKGINNNVNVLAELFNKLSYIGVPPYYMFICRPTAGNKPYQVPVEEALDMFERARLNMSGLAKRARLAMSHRTGKIEIVGRTDDQVFFRYHRAADPRKSGQIMIYASNPEATWFDDYTELIAAYSFTTSEDQRHAAELPESAYGHRMFA